MKQYLSIQLTELANSIECCLLEEGMGRDTINNSHADIMEVLRALNLVKARIIADNKTILTGGDVIAIEKELVELTTLLSKED